MKNSVYLLSSLLLLMGSEAAAQCVPQKDPNMNVTSWYRFEGPLWTSGMQDTVRNGANQWHWALQLYEPSAGVYEGPYGISVELEVGLQGTGVWGEYDYGQSVIRLNPEIFTTSGGPNFAEAVATHEIGHMLAYGHVGVGCNSVMREFMSPSNYFYGLGQADIDAVDRDYDGGWCGDPETCSPIILDLGQRGIALSGPDVWFDMNGTGPQLTAWTAPWTEDGLLVMDRNSDAMIGDARELFGEATPYSWDLNGAHAPHGFAALAFFDHPSQGGNGNGWIDPTDRVYPQLMVWIDADHDGISVPPELRRLGEAGVTHISCSPRVSRRRDRHGNEFRYRSPMVYGGELRTAWDVYLVSGSATQSPR